MGYGGSTRSEEEIGKDNIVYAPSIKNSEMKLNMGDDDETLVYVDWASNATNMEHVQHFMSPTFPIVVHVKRTDIVDAKGMWMSIVNDTRPGGSNFTGTMESKN
jgi:hypothetical protein